MLYCLVCKLCLDFVPLLLTPGDSMLLRSSLSLFAVSPPLWSSLIQIGCARCIKLIRKDLMAPLAGELRTMKISNDLFKSIITPEMKILEELFRRNK